MIICNKINGCLEPWQASLFAGIFSCATSIFDLMWSLANMLHEDHPIIFYILLAISIESVLFLLASCLLFVGLAKKKRWCFPAWMILAVIDITLDLTHNFVELSLPNRNYAAPCILALVGLFIRLFICTIMAYSLYSVYRQYKLLGENESKMTKIKIFPAEEDNASKGSKP